MRVYTHEIPISTDEPVTVVPISDCHVGNVGYDKKKLVDTVKWIKDNGAYTVLIGDQIDAILTSDPRFEIDSVHPDFRNKLDNLPYAQTDAVAKLFDPIKDHILGVMGGNHEFTVKKYYSFDSASVLSTMLDVPLLSDPCFLRLMFRRSKTSTFSKDVFCTHGLALGGGRKLGGKVNNLRDLATGFHADVYLAGHTHQLFTVTDKYIAPNARGRIEYKTRTFVNTGSFQKTYDVDQDIDTWASRKAFSPERTGVARLDFYLKPVGKSYKISTYARC